MVAALLTVVSPAAAAAAVPGQPIAASPASYKVKGIDTSRYQHEENGEKTPVLWSEVAKSYSFAFHKATQGTTHTDPNFREDFTAAAKTSLLHAPYHFFDPKSTTDGAAQARHFIRVTQAAGYRGPAAGQLPPVIDVEMVKGRCPASLRSDQIRAFSAEVKKAFGVAPIVYTNAHFVNSCMAGKGQVFSGHVQWLARYNAAKEPQQIPGTNRSWTFWQYTDKGSAPGIQGPVDLNVFHGTLAQLRALAGG
jgi:lysozyme